MRTILFGAGASFGSETVGMPPLGPQLFTSLVRFAPTVWGALSAPWPAEFSADFEAAMEKLISSGIFGSPFQWTMAEYFLTSFQASHASLYKRFLDDAKGSSVDLSISTLNYDTLLFQAANFAGAKLYCGGGGVH